MIEAKGEGAARLEEQVCGVGRAGEAGCRVLGPEPSLFSGAVCGLPRSPDPRPGEGEGLTQGLLHTHLVTTEQWGPWLRQTGTLGDLWWHKHGDTGESI